MKITLYELLGLIKDNKAPKKIRYDNLDYEFSTNDGVIDYIGIDKEMGGKYFLSSVIGSNYLNDIFSTTVEVLEEEKEIEELSLDDKFYFSEYGVGVLKDKINELIREVNKIKKEGK